MFFYFKKAAILAFTFLLILFLTISCMHVKNLDLPEIEGTREISLNLNRLNNLGGAVVDDFTSIIESDDYYITTGYSSSNLSALTGGAATSGSYDFAIARLNKSDLSLVTINNLGGLNGDYFYSLIESDGYYITVGRSDSDLSGLNGGKDTSGDYDFAIAKFNKTDLSLVNINNLGGAIADRFDSVIESGSYYIAVGSSASNLSGLSGGTDRVGSADAVIAKFNKSDLSLVTLNNLGGTSDEYFYSLIESGDYYITAGYSYSNLSSLTGGTSSAGGYDFIIAKFNKTDLSLVNINNLGGSSTDRFDSVVESGNYYITAGRSSSDLSSLTGGSNTSGDYDFVIARFNKADLSLININNFGGVNSDNFISMIESGNYYIAAGYSDSDLSGLTDGTNTVGNNDFVIAKINKTDLSLVNINNLGDTADDYFSAVIESDNHYIAAGRSSSNLLNLTGGENTEGVQDFVIIKFGD